MRLVACAFGVMLTLLVNAQDPGDFTFPDGVHCPPEGTAKSGDGKSLNRDKNREAAPPKNQMDPAVTLAAMLAPGDDLTRFDHKKGARIVGLVVGVKVGGKETCNCGEGAPDNRDTHIELALSKNAKGTQRVIVEVTPRLRAIMKQKGVDWRTSTLEQSNSQGIKGKWVDVTGWLTFDSMHVNEAENTNPGGAGNWRATCWELHPVTDIRVVTTPPSPAMAMAGDALSALQSAHAVQVRNDAASLESLKQRNQAILAKFDPDELDEDLPDVKAETPKSK